MNQLSEKAKIAKVVSTREGLSAFREDVMKKSAIGKPINTREYIATYKLPSMFLVHLLKLGAVKDNKPNAPRQEGKYVEWTYAPVGNENGRVDSKLVDAVLAAHKKYEQEYRAHKKEQKGEDPATHLPAKVVEKRSIKSSITDWIKKELNKDELLEGGYLKPDQKSMYLLIESTFSNLEELKQVVQNLKW